LLTYVKIKHCYANKWQQYYEMVMHLFRYSVMFIYITQLFLLTKNTLRRKHLKTYFRHYMQTNVYTYLKCSSFELSLSLSLRRLTASYMWESVYLNQILGLWVRRFSQYVQYIYCIVLWFVYISSKKGRLLLIMCIMCAVAKYLNKKQIKYHQIV